MLSPAQATLKMSLWQAEADSINSNNLYVWLQDSDLPQEVTLRLHDLITRTQSISGKVISVGKIVLIKIIDFIQKHPNLVMGFGIGITLGAAVNFLVSSIPFIGPFLAPLATALSTAFGIVIFGVAGHRLDKRAQGREIGKEVVGFAEDIVEIVKAFFQLVVDVFNTVRWEIA